MAFTRRHLLRDAFALGAVAGTASLIAACDAAITPDPTLTTAPLGAPETTTIRIAQVAACDPWAWMCEPFLRDEGFTDVQTWAKGADLWTDYSQHHVAVVDAGVPVVALAGMHTGCIEIWARPPIGTVTDLRGKTIAVGLKSGQYEGVPVADLFYGFWMALFAHVGLRPADATFLEVGDSFLAPDRLADGSADAVMAVAAQGPVLQARTGYPGRRILDGSLDKPWSQQICCLLVARSAWVRTNPVAAKRATRAILRTLDSIDGDRTLAAKIAAEKGLYKANPAFRGLSPDATAQVIVDVNKHAHLDWREYDVDETLQFFAVRLRDAQLIKKAPQQIVDAGASFAYARHFGKELKP